MHYCLTGFKTSKVKWKALGTRKEGFNQPGWTHTDAAHHGEVEMGSHWRKSKKVKLKFK